ncbi:MAG: site-specific integrase [Planctomycetes bacterium]|nr:site-specific integrase [Planctomycetota bacterium]
MPKKMPSYRRRKGSHQAVVTLTDARTRIRRDYWLGEYDSPESWERYHRILAEWQANGKCLLDLSEQQLGCGVSSTNVGEVILAYWRFAESYYRPHERDCIKVVLRLLKKFFGSLHVTEFGPKKLCFLREQMIKGDLKETPPRQSWSRVYCNQQVKRIRRVFKWASAQEMIPVEVHQRLATVESLKYGRCQAREGRPVKPVSLEMVDAVRPYLCRQIDALIDLQILTGARGGELLKMRPIDIAMDRKTGVWTYKPLEHKTAYRQKERVIIFGPRAQDVIKRFLEGRAVDAYLFSPREADAERRARLHESRKTPASCGNGPGTNRADNPERKPGEYYTSNTYHRAIQYACQQAFPPPEHLRPRLLPGGRRESKVVFRNRLSPNDRADLKSWHKTHRWHPHQLRHVAGTELRKQFGLEAAQLVLGHSSAQITDAVYAERDLQKLIDVMKQVG